MEQEHRLEELRQYARTTVMEQTETKTDSQTDSLSKLNLLTKQMSKIEPTVAPVQKEEISKEPVKEEAKETKSLSQIIMEQHLAKQNEEIKEEQEVEEVKEEKEEQVEEQVESLYASSLSLEASSENQLDEEHKVDGSSKSYKFRFRLLTGVFCLLLAIIGGWVIGEAVEIGKTSTEIVSETAQVAENNEYYINLTKLISNISKVDQDGNIKTPQEGNLLPIEELIPITPQALDDTTGYEEESNWFDKICNWIINIFGG